MSYRRGASPWKTDVSALPIDEYTRVSVDRKGRHISVTDQHEDNADCAELLQLTIGEWFDDNDRKASPGAVSRPDWLRLMKKVEEGRSGGFIVWDISRASRDHWFGASLVKVVRDHGLKGFRVVSSSTETVYDLSNDEDANAFIEEINRAEKEALLIRKRTARGMRKKIKRGEIPGGTKRRFGFIDVYENVQHPEERDLLREGAKRALDGERMLTIVTDWAERGIVTPKIMNNEGTKVVHEGGRGFSHTKLKDTLLRPCNAGYVAWKDGELVGKLPGEPIFDTSTYIELRDVLGTLPKGRPPRRKYLLTGPEWKLMRCASCGSVMSAMAAGDYRRQYRCTYNAHAPQGRGCLQSIDMAKTDEIITEAAYAWWTDPKRMARDAVVLADDATVRKLDARLSALQQRHARLVTSETPGLDQSLADLEAKIRALTEEREVLVRPQVREAATRAQIEARWNAGWDERRTMIKEAFRVIIIHPRSDEAKKGPKTFGQERIDARFIDEDEKTS